MYMYMGIHTIHDTCSHNVPQLLARLNLHTMCNLLHGFKLYWWLWCAAYQRTTTSWQRTALSSWPMSRAGFAYMYMYMCIIIHVHCTCTLYTSTYMYNVYTCNYYRCTCTCLLYVQVYMYTYKCIYIIHVYTHVLSCLTYWVRTYLSLSYHISIQHYIHRGVRITVPL